VSPRVLARLLVAYALFALVLAVVVHRAASLRPVDGEHIVSGWRKGELVVREVGRALDGIPDVTFVDEHVVGEGPFIASVEPVFALSIVAGVDGVAATYGGVTAYLTPDELLARQAYDRGITIPGLALALGVDVPLVEALLAQRLEVTVPELRARGRLRRVRTERVVAAAPPGSEGTRPEDVTPARLRSAALDAARFLARGLKSDGRFRYIVDAPTDRTLPGYDWPRQAGATFLLAQAAELSPEPLLRDAALRAGEFLRDGAMLDCGGSKCIGSEATVEIGSTALAIIAMSELARTGVGPGFREPVGELAKFLRRQQRPDGEFMHYFDRRSGHPLDLQVLYYSGEATLALARAHTLTGDPADLDAARRGLAHLVGPAWSFFGDRYYFGEEHWTCQAMGELWDRAPDEKALDFCERWREYDAHMMYAPGETPLDVDGAFGVGPLVTPRLTPVGSRTEAGVATLDAMIKAGKAGVDPAKRDALASQLRRSFALLMRQQLRPGRSYLFANPEDVYGAMPGSQVDWQLRIDFAQHAGSAMIRAASLWAGAGERSPGAGLPAPPAR
jgi:hypothetical protein